jgi:hypothetical protein
MEGVKGKILGYKQTYFGPLSSFHEIVVVFSIQYITSSSVFCFHEWGWTAQCLSENKSINLRMDSVTVLMVLSV